MSKTPPSGKPPKRTYQPPAVRTEPLTAVAALCNGSTSGGRKESTGAPNNCQAAKLKS